MEPENGPVASTLFLYKTVVLGGPCGRRVELSPTARPETCPAGPSAGKAR